MQVIADSGFAALRICGQHAGRLLKCWAKFADDPNTTKLSIKDMTSGDLLSNLDATELTLEATALMVWEIGAVSSMDEVARFMYRGGPWPPQASVKRPRHFKLSEDDPRPEKRYWAIVKDELTVFLCTNDKKYKELWSRINALEHKSTSTVVLIVSGYLGEKFGLQASMLAGFVAVFFYGVLKIGKESYCRLATSE